MRASLYPPTDTSVMHRGCLLSLPVQGWDSHPAPVPGWASPSQGPRPEAPSAPGIFLQESSWRGTNPGEARGKSIWSPKPRDGLIYVLRLLSCSGALGTPGGRGGQSPQGEAQTGVNRGGELVPEGDRAWVSLRVM